MADKSYWDLISESDSKAAESLKKYRDQMKQELDKYESYLKDIDSSLEKIDSTSYFIRGKFGTGLNNASEEIKGQSQGLKKYTDNSLSPAMESVCKIRSNEEIINMLHQGQSVKYEDMAARIPKAVEKLRNMVKLRDPKADLQKISPSTVKISDNGTVSYGEYQIHDYSLSSPVASGRAGQYEYGDIEQLRQEIKKLKSDVSEYGNRKVPLIQSLGQSSIGTAVSIQASKYAPIPASLQVVTSEPTQIIPTAAKYAPAPVSEPTIAPTQIVPTVAKYAPAPAIEPTIAPTRIIPTAAKYAPAPAEPTIAPTRIIPTVAKYAPAPAIEPTIAPTRIIPTAAKYAPAPAEPTIAPTRIIPTVAKYAPAPTIEPTIAPTHVIPTAAKYAPAPYTNNGKYDQFTTNGKIELQYK